MMVIVGMMVAVAKADLRETESDSCSIVLLKSKA